MKFLLATFLFVIVSQSVLAQSNDTSLRTRCTFFADRLILNCTGPTGRVECEAADEFPFKIKIVGISFPKDSSVPKFDLHPLRSDNTAWLDSPAVLDGKSVSFSIYEQQSIRDFGFRLRDAGCFSRLSALFKSSVANLNVPVTSEVTGVTKSTSKVQMLGEIFWFERSFINKSLVKKVKRITPEAMSKTIPETSKVIKAIESSKTMSKREPMPAVDTKM